METEENKTKAYNDEENEETPEDNSKKVISLDNADFSNKSQIINSPRSLEACLRVGVDPSELYKLNMDEFKKKISGCKKIKSRIIKI